MYIWERRQSLRRRVKELERQIDEGVGVTIPIAGEYAFVKISHCELAELFFKHVSKDTPSASKESK